MIDVPGDLSYEALGVGKRTMRHKRILQELLHTGTKGEGGGLLTPTLNTIDVRSQLHRCQRRKQRPRTYSPASSEVLSIRRELQVPNECAMGRNLLRWLQLSQLLHQNSHSALARRDLDRFRHSRGTRRRPLPLRRARRGHRGRRRSPSIREADRPQRVPPQLSTFTRLQRKLVDPSRLHRRTNNANNRAIAAQ